MLPSKPGFTQAQISNALALELVAKLSDLPDILDRYNLSKTALARLLRDPEFKVIYAQAKAHWGADANATERVLTKATLMVEDSLLEIYAILHGEDTSPAGKIQAFNALVDLSEASPKKQAAKQGADKEGFSITINLPGGQVAEYEVSNQPIEGELGDLDL